MKLLLNRKKKRLFKENNTKLDDEIFVRGCPIYFLHDDDELMMMMTMALNR